MLCSMTGYGAASSESGFTSYRIEIRSVNHRHLLVKTRLTAEFAHFEGDVERIVRKHLVRGAVSVYLNVTHAPGADALALDPDAAARYQQQWKRLSSRLGLEDGIPPATLLSLPGVLVSSESRGADPEKEQRLLLKLLGQALKRLAEMRQAEGNALMVDLRKHARASGRIVARIETRMPTVVRTHQANLRKRVAELLDGCQAVDPSELAREIALIADRLDVSEEISRLKSHLAQLETILDKGGAIGRKLDFLVQEIFRETNTIGSKCSDAKVAHWVVEAKTHVERLREQVQNVE